MKYNNIIVGKFISRTNRFVAVVEIDGKKENVHVKNTGRFKELLTEKAEVYLEHSDNPNRKTKYSLISVLNNGRVVNLDSQNTNYVWMEALENNFQVVGIHDKITKIKKEASVKNSRLDFYIETRTEKIYMEVKCVTLLENGVAKFPDAPTERGIKHIKELIELTKSNYKCFLIFLIQMSGANSFEPNDRTQKEFRTYLKKAVKAGVNILAYDCIVSPDEIIINKNIKVDI